MKKIIAGTCILVTGLILFIVVHLEASKYMVSLGSWSTPPGKYLTSVSETGGTVVLAISIIFGIIGLCMLLIGAFKKD